VPLPRPLAANVTELHELLTAAHIRPPFVIAGHSFGGMIMRLFASTYPHVVRALSPSTPPRRSSGAPSSCSSPRTN